MTVKLRSVVEVILNFSLGTCSCFLLLLAVVSETFFKVVLELLDTYQINSRILLELIERTR